MFTLSWLRTLTYRPIRTPLRRGRCRPTTRLTVQGLEDRTVPSVTFPLNDPGNLTPVGSTLYFAAGGARNELWRTDATTATSTFVKGGFTSIFQTAAISSTLYFIARDDSNNVVHFDLWKSDGTAGGTTLIKEFSPGGGPNLLTPVGSSLYFTADDGIHGREVWRSDGTPAGTMRLADFAAGLIVSNPGSLAAVGSRLYFTADIPSYGRELLTFDGTAGQPVYFFDIAFGPASSNPVQLTAAGSTLFFAATTQLWKAQGLSVQYIGGANDSGFDFPVRTFSNLTPAGSGMYFTAEDSLFFVGKKFVTVHPSQNV